MNELTKRMCPNIKINGPISIKIYESMHTLHTKKFLTFQTFAKIPVQLKCLSTIQNQVYE